MPRHWTPLEDLGVPDTLDALVWDFGTRAPDAWYSRALRLWVAAELIFEQVAQETEAINSGKKSLIESKYHELKGTATMLVGFALENALKGKALELGSVDFSSNPQKLELPISGHDLVEWARLASFRTDDHGDDVLARLGAYLLWAGRYPTPIHRNSIRTKKKGSSRGEYPAVLCADERRMVKAWLAHLTNFARFQ